MKLIYFACAVLLSLALVLAFYYKMAWVSAVLFALAILLLVTNTRKSGEKMHSKLTRRKDIDKTVYTSENKIYTKAVEDYNYLEKSVKRIGDKQLVAQIHKMQGIARNFILYMQRHPETVSPSRRFVEYYQDRAVTLVDQFIELEGTQLHTEEVEATKRNIKATLESFDEAYEDQFTSILNSKLLDVDAEIKVMNQSLEGDGIENQDRPSPFSQNTEEEPSKSYPWQKRPGTKVPAPTPDLSDSLLHGKASKRRIVTGFLAIFLGSFGAHKFYLHRTFQGILYVLFCWTCIPGIIGIIEGIRYLAMDTDAFYYKYLS